MSTTDNNRSIDAPEHILVKNHGKEQIQFFPPGFKLMSLVPVTEMVLTEIHMKEDGSTNGEPSFAIVFDKWDPGTNVGMRLYAEVSLCQLSKALSELGYTLYH